MSEEPVKEAAFFSTIRSWRLVRGDSRVFGGVLSGIGARIGMAPAPTRIIFVLLAVVTGGISLLAYAAAWALLPDSHGSIIIQDFGRGRPNVGALIALVVLTVFGFIFIGDVGLPGNWGWLRDQGMGGMGNLGGAFFALIAVLIPLAIIGGIVALIVWAVRSSNKSASPASGYARLPDGTIPTGPATTAMPDAAVASTGDDSSAPATKAAATKTATSKASTTKAAASKDPATAASATAASATVPAATAPAIAVAPAPLPPTYVAPPAPPVYSAPPRPRVPGPGKVGYLLALAWIPLSIAITVYLSSQDRLAVYPVLAAGVIWVAGLGVILAITALRGRKLGFLGFVSVVSLIPVGILIGTADEVRADYANSNGSNWTLWWGENPTIDEWVSEAPVPEPENFDAGKTFWDYSAIAIDGTCWDIQIEEDAYADGTVRLAEVPADQTITVTAPNTRLMIPNGTSVAIVPVEADGSAPSVDVIWDQRDVSCTLNYGTTTGVTLTNPDEPTLTVRLLDTQQYGSMSLRIEEN